MFEKISLIKSAEEIKEEYPLSELSKKIKADRDEEIRRIIDGRDDRKIFVVGPCSADNEDAVLDYVSRLSRLAETVKSRLFLLPRIYTNKPRTRGEGYKGLLHSPDPKKGTDIQKGIVAIRTIHLRALSESGMSSADEMLYPENYGYLDDVLSYVTVGARSSENQQHRLVAGGAEVPVGIKNPMSGSFSALVNSIYAAQIPSEFKYGSYQVKTTGNSYAHAVLRGSVDTYGNNIPNYHYENIMQFRDMYLKEGLKNPAIIIDTNHSNSNKDPFEQVRIVKELISNMRRSSELNGIVKGFLTESYIEDGHQNVNEKVYGKSITDACLGWEKTERLILDAAEKL